MLRAAHGRCLAPAQALEPNPDTKCNLRAKPLRTVSCKVNQGPKYGRDGTAKSTRILLNRRGAETQSTTNGTLRLCASAVQKSLLLLGWVLPSWRFLIPG